MKIVLISLAVFSIGLIVMPGTAASTLLSNVGTSGSSFIFQDGKPVYQIIGDSGVQPFDNSTFMILDQSAGIFSTSNQLVNWTFSHNYANSTYARYVNGKFVGFYTESFNTSA